MNWMVMNHSKQHECSIHKRMCGCARAHTLQLYINSLLVSVHYFSPCICLTVVLACGTTHSSSWITNFVQVVNYSCQYQITLSFHTVRFLLGETVVVTARAEKVRQ